MKHSAAPHFLPQLAILTDVLGIPPNSAHQPPILGRTFAQPSLCSVFKGFDAIWPLMQGNI